LVARLATQLLFDSLVSEVGATSAIGVKSLFVIGPGPTFDRVRAFEPDEWLDIEASLRLINSVATGFKFMDASLNNYEEFAASYKALVSAGHNAVDEPVRFALTDEMNRRLSNYLSSMRLLLDFNQTRFKRWYRSHPELLDAFRQQRATLFDSSFEYRFAYKLRNYSQHFGMPIGQVEVTERSVDVERDLSESHVIGAFDTTDLLSVGGDCWGSVRRDLREMGTSIDVAEVMGRVPELLSTLWRDELLLEREYIEVAASILGEAFVTPDGKTGTAVLGEWTDVDGRFGLSYTYPPFNVIFRTRDLLAAG